MTYYEEFGVPETASREEIRQAYKHLTQLIHPDQCSDEAIRRLADLQLKRLNGVLEILQDSATRERYDRSLAALAVATTGAPLPAVRERMNLVWVFRTAVAAAALAFTLAILLWRPAQLPRAQVAARITDPSPIEPAGTIPHARRTPNPPVRLLPEPEWEPLASRASEWPIALASLPSPEPVMVAKPPIASANAGPAVHATELTGTPAQRPYIRKIE
jgi:hypothetical protein